MNSTDTPIYDELTEGTAETSQPDAVVNKFLSDSITLRKWIYNVAIALLVIVGALQTGEAIALESWSNLISVILNLGGIGAVSLARANVR